METLLTFYPNVDDLLQTPPEDLAPILLKLARANVQNGMFHPDTVNGAATGTLFSHSFGAPYATAAPRYPMYKQREVDALLSQTWGWIERNDLITPAADINGRNGFMVFTQKGERTSSEADFLKLKEAAAFPKSLIHPLIAEKVWRALMRNDLDEAVFAAFKAVEENVRVAGGFAPSDIGVPLMREAFDKATGPLSDPSQPEVEREALAHLFAGAIGSYKNPHSHRTVNLTDLREAQEQVMLASHLLHIVDARRKP